MKRLQAINLNRLSTATQTTPVYRETGIHAIATVTVGSSYAFYVEVTADGVNWVKFSPVITHATTTTPRAFDLGLGWYGVRINCTDATTLTSIDATVLAFNE